MTEQPAKIRVGDLYWKQVGSNGWVLGKVTAYDDDTTTATFELVDEDSGDVQRPVQKELVNVTVAPLFPSNPLFSTCADMTSLHHLHEAALVKNLQDRSVLSNQRPYTFMANVLIAINPLRYLEEPDKNSYIGQSLDRCPPHPYHVAESAYRQLATVRPVMQNQSIIISGESGSGKTETSKIILDFLTVRAMSSNRQHRQSGDDCSDEPEVTTKQHKRVSLRQARVLSSFSSRDISCMLTSNSAVTLGERLMETIPILESFGNAKTHRNHNSSRFGKYMRLQFSSRHHELTGASIDTYLLEKSRLVHPPTGERNFHIFYELLRSGRVDLLDQLHLTASLDPELMISSFYYLNRSGCTASEILDDGTNFHKLVDALQLVGIDATMQLDLFRLVAGVLHLGNVSFDEEETEEGTTACIGPNGQEALEIASSLLGMQKDLLSCAMLNKRITRSTPGSSRRNSIYYLKKDIRQATYSRDTIAKTVYEHVFTWLMRRCASALEYNEALRDVLPYIGVLDIFGFEDFEPRNRNSFEQLLINYANETLQSIFNTCIFQAEQELYKSEHIHVPNNVSLAFPFPLHKCGIDQPKATGGDTSVKLLAERLNDTSELISYVDNQECLNLIASRSGGVFSTIDAISRLPGPSDRKLNERLHTLFKRHPCFPTPHPKEAHEMFCIVHYAGMVKYHIESFIDKNNNIISAQFEELMAISKSSVLQAQPLLSSASANSSPPTSQKGGSVTHMFSVQMRGLASELEGTRCNFIRCIKPNAEMEVGVFDRASVVDQLRCSGTVQACSVLRVGLPTRILYAEVVDTYLPLVGQETYEKFNCNERLFTQAICAALAFPSDAYRLGDTRLFFRTGKIDLLDKLLNVNKMEAHVPKMLVNYLVKRRWLSAVTKVMVYKMWEKVFVECRYRRSSMTIQCWWRQYKARQERKSLAAQARVAAMLAKWAKKLQVMKSFAGKPDEKIELLNNLLAKPVVPRGQKWLLTWLGPLQRAMYVQKLCRKACVAFLVKRGFLWLYQQVRVKRAQLLLQTQARIVLAKRRLLQLVRKRRAKNLWRKAIFGARVMSIFNREFNRVHLHRLEQGHEELTAANLALHAKVADLSMKLDAVELEKKQLQRLVASTATALAERNARLQLLEAKIKTQQAQVVHQDSLMLRLFKFFTCSSSSSAAAKNHRHAVDDSSESSVATSMSDESSFADDVSVKPVNLAPPRPRKHRANNHVWKISRFCF
ncbi:hypothetical protein H310_05533 [Aphanomyces invadans]|uniref:Myosin motor domain-containing protein n=1 Tax=Aphanomyces invadans TaxID=157072 RepID=A0A024UB30_9STRA|nr:hypothetical protein H310_05533 [Aphanomyces invadans]ETW03107.1 hypothetical protein H310_05533 [Aphanomyces invadans]|eukprot:XP_008868491.1 hypothetical protein H310_05533 [Aphanomyces invadans]